jgi:hypothetical protein
MGTLSKHFTASGLGLDNATPLNVAAKFGLESISSVLLSRRYEVDGENKPTWTALHSIARVSRIFKEPRQKYRKLVIQCKLTTRLHFR